MAARKKKTTTKKRSPLEQVRDAALTYPGTTEEFPWGDCVVKVKGKVFVFLGENGLSVKLPDSGMTALTLPFCEPTRYGLGKSGWVSATFPNAKSMPVPLLLAWLDESYRAIAPKKLVAALPEKTKR